MIESLDASKIFIKVQVLASIKSDFDREFENNKYRQFSKKTRIFKKKILLEYLNKMRLITKKSFITKLDENSQPIYF